MKKRMKSILVLCLVVALCAGMAVPAFAADATQATAYVTQLYRGLLNRDPDNNGLYLFVNKILNESMNAAGVAEAIASSSEFRNRQLSNEEYVKALYKGLLNRDADSNGLATFKGALDVGYSRSWVLQQLLSSLEYVSVCVNYGLFVGSVSASTTTNVSQTSVNSSLASSYVTRLYVYLLGRDPDATGLATWTEKLTKREMSAAGVAANIASSGEFSARSLTNGEYVQAIYQALLGRAVDGNGWTTFMTALSSGKSRSWVFSSICASAEFKSQFGEMNATSGTVSAGSYSITGNTVNATACGAFVDRVYLNLLGRYPDAAGRQNWVDILVNRQMSAAGVAAAIASSSESRARDITRTDFITAVYWALLDRAPDPTGLNTYTNALTNGYSRAWVFTKICASSEFQNRSEFSDMNVVPGYLNSASYNMG